MAQNIFHCPEDLVVTGTVTVGDAFVPAVDPIKSLVQLHGESEREAEPEGVRCQVASTRVVYEPELIGVTGVS